MKFPLLGEQKIKRVWRNEEKMASVVKLPPLPQIEISDKLQHEMGPDRYEALVRMANAGGVAPRDVNKLIGDIMADVGKDMAKPMAAAQAAQGTLNQNYEAAIYSRLQVLGAQHKFELLKVHRSRDGSKFFIFTVVNDNWSVLEDDELFPSDKLISALRCLTL